MQTVGDTLQELLRTAGSAEQEVLEALLTHAGRGSASMTDAAAVLVVPGRDGRQFVVVLDPDALDSGLNPQPLPPGPPPPEAFAGELNPQPLPPGPVEL